MSLSIATLDLRLISSCRFLPNAGRYICNVLSGKSNGEEKDQAWAWKKDGWDIRDRSPDHPKLGAGTPNRELKDIGIEIQRSRL